MPYTENRPVAYLVAAALLFTAGRLVHADPEGDFVALYGREVEAVKATAGLEDDLVLAKTLINTAESPEVKPDMRRVLARQAATLAAASPDGVEIVVRGIELSAEEGASRLSVLERIADVRQDQYTKSRGDARGPAAEALIAALSEAGAEARRTNELDPATTLYRRAYNVATAVRSPMREDLRLKIEQVTQLKRIDQLIASAKAKLQADPTDAAAGAELMNLYIVERDDPAEARKYSFVVSDATLKENVKLAVGDAAELAEGQRFLLGEWYMGLTDSARSQDSKVSMFQRARTYYTAYLDGNPSDPVHRGKADHAIQRIDAELAALQPSGTTSASAIAPGRWVDLLAKTDPAKHAKRGAWKREGDKIGIAAGGMSQVMFPVVPAGSYEISVKMARTGGTAAGVYLPLGPNGVLLTCGFRVDGSFIVHGLSRVDRREVSDRDNPTRKQGVVSDLEGPVVVLIKVRTKDDQATVAATLNGKPIVTWSGPVASLDAHSITRSRNTECPGVFGWNAGIVLHEAKLRMTDGSAEWLADDKLRDIPAGEQLGEDIAEGLGDAARRGAEEAGRRNNDGDRPRIPGGFPRRPGR